MIVLPPVVLLVVEVEVEGAGELVVAGVATTGAAVTG